MNRIVLLLLIMLTCCTNRSSKVPVVFEFPSIADMSVSGRPLQLTKAELMSLYGEPDTVFAGGAFRTATEQAGHDSLVEYDSHLYRDLQMQFAVWDNRAQITLVDFRNSDIEVFHPVIGLSENTRISEIADKFPDVYKSRNEELNGLFGWDPGSVLGTSKEDTDWVVFKNGKERVELTFHKGNLVLASFDVVH